MIHLTDRGKLALAIYRGDHEAARRIIDLMAVRSGKWALAVQAARRAINPPAPLPDRPAELFPKPAQAAVESESVSA